MDFSQLQIMINISYKFMLSSNSVIKNISEYSDMLFVCSVSIIGLVRKQIERVKKLCE